MLGEMSSVSGDVMEYSAETVPLQGRTAPPELLEVLHACRSSRAVCRPFIVYQVCREEGIFLLHFRLARHQFPPLTGSASGMRP